MTPIPESFVKEVARLATAHREYVRQLEVEYIDPVFTQWRAGEITDDQMQEFVSGLEQLRYTWHCPTEAEPYAHADEPIFPGVPSAFRMIRRIRDKKENGC